MPTASGASRRAPPAENASAQLAIYEEAHRLFRVKSERGAPESAVRCSASC